ncbi:MAG: periplasmic heavy metal sensor [Deltaproteobacteria bacterium]|nr:periplasmic heavy metal sensor [Deltaproteobacteria bacterium]
MNALRARPWALLFVISLAINLFLGGMLTARWLQRSRAGGGPMGFGPPAFRVLGPEARPIAERVWTSRREEVSQRMRAAREARKHSAEALSAEPFDAAKAAAALADARAKTASAEELVNQIMVEIAGALPPAERAKLGQAMEHGRGPRARGR